MQRVHYFHSVLISLLIFLAAKPVEAQYYNTGTSPASLRWHQIKSPDYRLIFPDFYSQSARRIAILADTIRPYVTFGLHPKIDRIPIVIHPLDMYSNGVVTWAPKRMELYTVPSVDNFAVPWEKQLIAHEYRHVVQMSNLNRHFIKGLSYVLGEQIVGAAALLLPGWYLEGDATLAETEMTLFGRGRQPEFSIELRAILNERAFFSMDKWVCGSYKDYVPDQYRFGYHIVSGAQTLYGADFWDKVLTYTSKYPFLIASPAIAYRKYGNTNATRMTRTVMGELRAYWESISAIGNSADLLVERPRTYTTYQYPVYTGSSVVSLKSDFDKPARFVLTDPLTGAEQTLKYTGNVSSRPVIADGRMYWTEYRPSLFWSHQSYSVVKSMNIASALDRFSADQSTGRSSVKTHTAKTAGFFVTPISGGRFALMELDQLNRARIVITDEEFRTTDEITFDQPTSLNGMAWDETTQRLIIIGLDDTGMWLGAISPQTKTLEQLTEPSYITRKNLTVADGKAWFNSIQSGKDEIHCFDLTENREYRLTRSQYGSSGPSAYGNHAYFTTYTGKGYLLARENNTSEKLVPVTQAKMPEDVLHPQRLSWNAVKLDTIQLGIQDTTFNEKRYRKFPNLFRIHSWMPVSINVNRLVSEQNVPDDIGVGATLISQSLLNDLTLSGGYGWVNSHNLLRADIDYTGLPVIISAGVQYGGGRQKVYSQNDADYDLDLPGRKLALEVQGTLSLPFNLSSGRWLRSLTPMAALAHYNGLLWQRNAQSADELKEGFDKLIYGITYSTSTRMARKNLRPQYGYTIELLGGTNPFRNNFGKLYSAFSRIYLPGLFPNHSLMLRGAVQYQQLDDYNYRQKRLFPRGCYYDWAPRNLYAGAVDYKFPVVYPDGGIRNIIYIKRINLNLFADYALYKYRNNAGNMLKKNPYSYGGDVEFNFNVLRANLDYSLTLSVYKPSDREKVRFNAGLSFVL